ncbi:hypothetical protein CDD82_5350 [Ophiocordyceps australis]|uniref:IQ domain-containing protein IQM6 n=1 Tax=Ophiocordyceps australis TaxID=1399860 RepID=A0A2C5ZT68_9HYPO|nr:hypothetical protein CDD82_5350 [Ophiocordyceps australis]
MSHAVSHAPRPTTANHTVYDTANAPQNQQRQQHQEYMDSLVPPNRERFEHIAHVQEEKEIEAKRRARERRKSQTTPTSPRPRPYHDQQQEPLHGADEAARMIQKAFRGYRTRREMQGLSLDAGTRWVTAIREAQFRQSTKPRAGPGIGLDPPATPGSPGGNMLSLDDPLDRRPSNARRNWKKASLVARRAGCDDTDPDSDLDSDSDSELDTGEEEESSSVSASSQSGQRQRQRKTPEQRSEARQRRQKANAERRQAARTMGLQYFLEMVDAKHRYGSNLRMYHEEWKKSQTTQNFFFWLDYGDGMHLELDTCPRHRLEREQVRYLSREERQYYLVKIDKDGCLCWAKNDEPIDTTVQYRDSTHGIVPADDPTPAHRQTAQETEKSEPRLSRKLSSLSLSSAESRREADRAAKYADPPEYQGMHKVTHISASTIFNKLLRKSVRTNTWIFVVDTSFRLYVGIKDSGAFQHSSFLQGSRISAAGLIRIRNGYLTSLSPLSGHYRPPASNFRAFVRSLRGEGVDMSHVSISKSYAVLVGLETYAKTRSKGRQLVDSLVRRRDKIMAPDQVRRREEADRDKSESAEKERRFLERQRLEHEANSPKAGERLLEKLRSKPVNTMGES